MRLVVLVSVFLAGFILPIESGGVSLRKSRQKNIATWKGPGCGGPLSHETVSIVHEGKNREFLIKVPSRLCSQDANQKPLFFPVIFALHCFGCTAELEMQRFERATEYFIVVAPQGIDMSWNAIDCWLKLFFSRSFRFGYTSKVVDLLVILQRER